MSKTKPLYRFLSLALCVCLCLTLLPVTASAKQTPPLGETVTIAAFDTPADEILFQGGEEQDAESAAMLSFPDSLTGTDTEGNAITISGVTWESAPPFDPDKEIAYPGYELQAVLPEGYTLDDGVGAPVITVFVRPAGGVPFAPTAATHTWDGTTANPPTVADGDTVNISSADGGAGGGTLTVPAGATVTIMGVADMAPTTAGTAGITINLSDDSTIVWNASLTGSTSSDGVGQNPPLVQIIGGGAFEMADSNAKIKNNNNNTYNCGALSTDGNVTVSGGTLDCIETAILATGADAVVTINGSAVVGGSGFVGVSASGENAQIYIGGTAQISGSPSTNDAVVKTAGANATINISGGTVSALRGGYAVYANGGGSVTMTGGEVKAAGSANGIQGSVNGSFTMENGSVTAGTQRAVNGFTTVTIKNGTVHSDSASSSGIYMSCGSGNSSALTVKGGKISSNSGTAIMLYSTEGSNRNSVTVNIEGGEVSSVDGNAIGEGVQSDIFHINISGGKVMAGSDYAICNFGEIGSTITVTGGAVFAYGSRIVGKESYDVILKSDTVTYTPPQDNGVVIAWDSTQTDPYIEGTKDNITTDPGTLTAENVWWAKQGEYSGISYSHGATFGFIKVDGVTVTGTDTTSPTLTAGAVERISDTAATVKFTSDEAGEYYYTVVDSGAATPAINTESGGTSCDTTENTISLSILTAGAKDIYIVVKDEAGNVSEDTFKIAIPAYVPAVSTLTSASVSITAPVAGVAPQDLAAVQGTNTTQNFTVTAFSWNESMTSPGGKFAAGTVYTATVTLTANAGHKFQAGAFTPTVTGADSVGTTETNGGDVEGNNVTFTVTFPQTEVKTVTGIAVKNQPDKLNYIENETLDLSGLVATLTYNDGTAEDVGYEDFGTHSITVAYDDAAAAHGDLLTVAHHNKSIVVGYGLNTANTSPLSVTAGAASTVNITGRSVTQIKIDIEAALVSGPTVTVVGEKTDANETLTLTISDEKTVAWKATYSGTGSGAPNHLITLNGGGTFDVQGGVITQAGATGAAIQTSSAAMKLIISGGTVTNNNSNSDTLIYMSIVPGSASVINVTVSGGTVHALGGKAISSLGSVSVTGGTIKSENRAVISTGDGSTVTVSGDANLICTGEDPIIDGYYPFNVTINGGFISTMKASAFSSFQGASTVTVNGGVIFVRSNNANTVVDLRGTDSTYTPPAANGVVVAWTGGGGGSYTEGTNTNLSKAPQSAAVYWSKNGGSENGIYYANGTTEGFIPLADVTVSAGGAPSDLEAQTIAITAPVTDDAAQTTIASGTGYTGVISWYNETDSAAHTGAFLGGKVYKATVTLTSTGNYKWPSAPPDISVSGGQTAENIVINGSGTGNTLTFTVTFASTLASNLVIVASGSISDAEAGDQKITGLAADHKYVISYDGSWYGVQADGTVDSNNSTTSAALAAAYAVALEGMEITGLTNDTIYQVLEVVTLETVAADEGSGTADTTALTLTFDKAITGLTIGNITIENASGAVTKGTTLGGIGPTYTVPVMVATAGNVTVKATAPAGYVVLPTAGVSVEVVKGLGSQTIVFPGDNADVNKTYGDAAFTHEATLQGNGSNNAITYASDNDNVATVNQSTGEVTINGVGTATITATKAADAAYAEATASYDLIVGKKALTITGVTATKEYDGTAVINSPVFTLSGFAGGDTAADVSVDWGATTAAYTSPNAGTITINVTAMGLDGSKSGFYTVTPADNIPVTGGITKKDITIDSVTTLTKDWDGTESATAGAVTFDSLVTGETLTVDTDYSVDAKFTGDNYNAGTGKSYTYTIALLNTTEANNYNLTNAAKTGSDGVINKIDYPGAPLAVSVNVKALEATAGKTVDLPALPDGASYPSGGTFSGNAISNVDISDTTLTFDVNDTMADTASETMTLTVNNATNHNPYNVVVTVTAQAALQENTPTATINFMTEKLTGLVADAAYKVNGVAKTADASGNIAIEATWFGQTVSIIKTAVAAGSTADSDAQSLDIPTRPAAPAIGKTDTAGGNNNGTITGVTTAMEYKLSTTSTWADCTGTTIIGLAAGTYNVRVKATADVFSGEHASATIDSSAPPQQTYTVTFNGNGGTPITQTKTVTTPAANVGALPTAPTRGGYTFNGWNTQQNGGGTAFTASTTVNGDITVYALWTYNGGNGGSGGSTRGGGGSTATPTTPATPETGDNKLTTPRGQNPVVDRNGNTTLPGGGTVETPGGAEIEAPAGTTIDKNGNVTIPDGKEAEVTLPGGTEITLPGGSSIGNDGDITIPPGKTAKTTLPGGQEVTFPGGSSISNNGNITTGGNTQLNLPGEKKIDAPKGSTITSDGKLTVGTAGATFTGGGMTLHVEGGTVIILDEVVPLGYLVLFDSPFTDVKNSDWFYNNVGLAYTHRLFSGTSATTFGPGESMTRGMFATVLSRLDGVDLSGHTTSRFGDVAYGQWYTAPIEWAADMGIVSGTGGNTFNPNAPVTREQMAVMLYNYMKYKGIAIPEDKAAAFVDEDNINPWALEAVRVIRAMGIVSGKPGNLFDPQGVATRAEVAAIFSRFVEYLAAGAK